MKTTLKYRIIELISAAGPEFYSISDIAKKLSVAYSHAHIFVKKLASEDAITIQKIGNVSVCRPNLKNVMARAYLTQIEARKTSEWIRKNPQSSKIMEKIELIKDNVHCVLIKNNKVIIIAPEKITGADFTMFRNRIVVTQRQIARHKGSVILHGAEKYWGLMGTH
ncbi:hypothetical protein HQ545_01140 [Candidatus Woesearchaeota archaeon]|nr:hypothetical protein [Candidatus Woesearchaeota archaeon]